MFRNQYQGGIVSIFYACGSKPLSIWDKIIKDGAVQFMQDPEIKSSVLDISGTNISTTYITCPKNLDDSIGIRLPFLVLIIKNMKRYFSFEVTILDDQNIRRRFNASNYQSKTKCGLLLASMPLCLSDGWNQIHFNLADFTRKAYGTQYKETVRIEIHANVRLRRIYFAPRLYEDKDLAKEFKLYFPICEAKSRPSRLHMKNNSKRAKSANKQPPPPPVNSPRGKVN